MAILTPKWPYSAFFGQIASTTSILDVLITDIAMYPPVLLCNKGGFMLKNSHEFRKSKVRPGGWVGVLANHAVPRRTDVRTLVTHLDCEKRVRARVEFLKIENHVDGLWHHDATKKYLKLHRERAS